jgi:hypothetical protein
MERGLPLSRTKGERYSSHPDEPCAAARAVIGRGWYRPLRRLPLALIHSRVVPDLVIAEHVESAADGIIDLYYDLC